jgi:hypothetical protein
MIEYLTFTAFLLQFLMNSKESLDNVPWWDCIHTYYVFPEAYTSIIDDILINSGYGVIGQKEILSNNAVIPSLGYHYFYGVNTSNITNLYFRITFEKISRILDNSEIRYYRAYVRPYCEYIIQKAIKCIFLTSSNLIRTISIDTSQHTPKHIYTTKKYNTPNNNQLIASNSIINHYINNDCNTKVFIYGSRGIGKTFTGRVTKKGLENKFPNMVVKLFDDFNPSSIGVNIKSMILNQAFTQTPVIVIIDEIDIIFNDVITEREMYGDSRLLHTQNKVTFNQMMDAIGDTKNVIAIFTSEKSPLELMKIHPDYKSFMRKGRIDYFINMTQKDAKIINHYDICE